MLVSFDLQVSFDWKVTNPTITDERGKKNINAQGQSPLSNVNKDVDISKVGENDMPF
jgi:hypothetical protein